MVYLGPFLSLLKATDVGGTITGTVAVALQRILASDLIRESERHAANVSERSQRGGLTVRAARVPV